MILPHTVTIVRAAITENRYGGDELDWDNATRTDVRGWVQQRSSLETVAAGRSSTTTGWKVFLPARVDIGRKDRVEHGANMFEVQGDPRTLTTPAGAHHVEADLQKVSG